jgi:hypothetical protein
MHLELKAGSGMAVTNKLLSELTLPSMPQQDWQLANYLVPKLEVIGLCPNFQCTSDDVLAILMHGQVSLLKKLQLDLKHYGFYLSSSARLRLRESRTRCTQETMLMVALIIGE